MSRCKDIPIGDVYPPNAKVGDWFSKRESNGKSRICLYVACSFCGKERWVRKIKALKNPRCLSCAARQTTPKRSQSCHWKGGRLSSSDGYVKVIIEPNDFFFPMAGYNGYVLEHRLVMAKHVKRCLLSWEVVHHKNGIKQDNRLENLALLSVTGEHNTQLDKEIKRQARIIKDLRLFGK